MSADLIARMIHDGMFDEDVVERFTKMYNEGRVDISTYTDDELSMLLGVTVRKMRFEFVDAKRDPKVFINASYGVIVWGCETRDS